jgi:hypothetical protein
MSRQLATIACTSLTLALAACGGGDGAVGSAGLAPVTPSAVAPTLPATGTWVIVSAGDGTPSGNYDQSFDTVNYNPTPQEATEGVNGSYIQLAPMLTISGAATDSEPAAQVNLQFDSAKPTRYLVVVQTTKKTTYACYSKEFTTQEVNDIIAASVQLNDLTGLAPCIGSLTLDATKRTYQSTGLTLTDLKGGTNKLELKVNHTWPEA